MSSNQDKGITSGRIEATDDVEGHTGFVTRVDDSDTDEVEGHAANVKHIDGSEPDDVEGHMPKLGQGGLVEDDDDETEGHRFSGN